MTGIKDVAREAGVSASTVSYVLSGKRSISAKTTEKVMAAVDKLGYTPDASARKMRGMRNQLIALSSPIRGDINKARYNAYFLHTAWAARNAGYDVMLLTGPDATKDIRRVTQSNLVDGVVLLDVEQDDERAAAAMTFPKPCVAIGYPSSHAGCACVDIDFALMGRKAVDFLYEKGHRTVAFLRNNESDYDRRSGYVILFRESLLAHAKERGMTIIESEHYEKIVSMRSGSSAPFSRGPTAHPPSSTRRMRRAQPSVGGAARQWNDDSAGRSVLSCGTYFEGEPTRFPITEMPVMPEELCAEAVNLLTSAIEERADINGSVKLIEPALKRRGSVAEAGSGGTQ